MGLSVAAILFFLVVVWSLSEYLSQAQVTGTLLFLGGICLASGGVAMVLAGSWRGR